MSTINPENIRQHLKMAYAQGIPIPVLAELDPRSRHALDIFTAMHHGHGDSLSSGHIEILTPDQAGTLLHEHAGRAGNLFGSIVESVQIIFQTWLVCASPKDLSLISINDGHACVSLSAAYETGSITSCHVLKDATSDGFMVMTLEALLTGGGFGLFDDTGASPELDQDSLAIILEAHQDRPDVVAEVISVLRSLAQKKAQQVSKVLESHPRLQELRPVVQCELRERYLQPSRQ